ASVPRTIQMSTMNRMRLYRRHGRKCKFFGSEDAFSKTNCGSPIYVDSGSRGTAARKSLGVRDWARAESKLRRMELAADSGKPGVKITEACEAFMSDCRRRNLKRSTIRSYEKALE